MPIEFLSSIKVYEKLDSHQGLPSGVICIPFNPLLIDLRVKMTKIYGVNEPMG